MFRTAARRRGARGMFLIVFTLLVGLVTVGPAAGNTGPVLPSNAHPQGYSLDRMTRELALFTTSGNQAKYYPRTPFQILYGASAAFVSVPDGDGILTTGSNHFRVRTGTMFFVPVWNADDSPIVAGTYPRSSKAAESYFFEPTQLGAQGFEIVVDGKSTPLGAGYLGGPVRTRPLLDGGGRNMITLGAFLRPLGPGHHEVVIRGGLFGDLIQLTYGPAFFREEITYQVDVDR